MMEGAFPKTAIRLVVSDIDGTLVNRAKVLTPRARATIQALNKRGIGFTVTSARPPVGLRSIIDLLRLKLPVAAVNGGAIVRPDLSVIEEKLLSPEAAGRAIGALREQGIDAWLFTNEHWFIRDPEGAHVDHEAKTIGQAPTVVAEFNPADVARALKIVAASHDHPHLAACETLLQAALGTTALATRSQVYYLDVTNPRANKGEAVLSLARALDISPDDVLTIGDGANDVPMFGKSGFSVAMGNGSEAVKSAAMAVTADCESEGFSTAMDRYVLSFPQGQPASGEAVAS